jgi:hypothetical protein
VRSFERAGIYPELLDHESPKQRDRISDGPFDRVVVTRYSEVLYAHQPGARLAKRARISYGKYSVRRLRI